MATPKPHLQVIGAVQPARPKVEFDRCVLHGRFLRSTGDGLVLTCGDCGLDKRLGLSPEQAAERAYHLRVDCLDACGLSGRFRGVTLDHFVATTAAQRAVLRDCRTFAQTAGRSISGSLMLLGSCGTGKTHLMSGMASHMALERHMSPIVTTPRAIVRRLRACWVKGSKETEANVIDSLCDADVLFLDEVGMGFGTDGELMQLFEVIDARYVQDSPIVIAGNLNVPAMKAALGDRIFDRLRENAKVLACNWPSHRGAA